MIDQSSPNFEGDVEIIAGRKCRPFSLGTFAMCQRLGLTMFVPPDDAPRPQLSLAEQMGQVAGYLWLQTGDLKQRIEAINRGTARAEIDLSMFDLMVADLEPTINAIMESVGRVVDARVEVQPKPDEKPEQQPPNS